MSAVLIALDWGTTNVRAALLNQEGAVIEQRQAESGVGHFSKVQFENHFKSLTQDWPTVPAIAAGMVGSRQGWHEAPYLSCPASPADLADGLVRFELESQPITLVPGLKLDNINRHDVMRGEECQLAGLLRHDPNFSGTVIMPGTHSKWVSINHGSIENFQTYMTGDIFEALSKNTILRHSVDVKNGEEKHFAEKVASLAKDKRSIEGQLFALRARQLLQNTEAGQLRWELSALLIGAEIEAGKRDAFDLAGPVILIGSDELVKLYETALSAFNIECTRKEASGLIWPALFDLAQRADIF